MWIHINIIYIYASPGNQTWPLESFHDKTLRFEWEDHRTRRWIFHLFDYQRISWIFYDYLSSIPTKPYKTIQNHIIQPYYPIYYPHVSKSTHFSLFRSPKKAVALRARLVGKFRKAALGHQLFVSVVPRVLEIMGYHGIVWESMGK